MEIESETTSTSTLQHLHDCANWSMKRCSDTMNLILPITIKSGNLRPDGLLPTEMREVFYKLREELRLTLQDVSDYLSYVDTLIAKESNIITSVTMVESPIDFSESK